MKEVPLLKTLSSPILAQIAPLTIIVSETQSTGITSEILSGLTCKCVSIPIPLNKNTAESAVIPSTHPYTGYYTAAPIIAGLIIVKVIFSLFLSSKILSVNALVNTYVLGKEPRILFVYKSNS